MSSDPLHRLSADLESAIAAAMDVHDDPPIGLRPVEPGTGGRSYLVAFEGPAFLCLRDDMQPETSRARVDEIARVALVVESAEHLIDPDALRALAPAVLGLVPWQADIAVAIGALRRAGVCAGELADWREDPLRVIASLVALDDAIACQDRARAAYASFVGATEPLVAKQDELAPDFVRALGAVESAAAAAGLADALGGVVAAGMDAIEEGADEMTAAHITPLR